MDSIFGIQGNDFVMVAADTTSAHSILKFKDTEDKILQLDSNKIIGISGETPDRLQFGDFIQKNIQLYKYRNNVQLGVRETANWIRSEIAEALRKGPYMVNGLIAGYDDEGPALYWLDYLGTMQKMSRGAQGYAGYFLKGLLDNFFKPELTREDGLTIIKYCINELKTRFLISQTAFIVKIVTKDGIEVIKL